MERTLYPRRSSRLLFQFFSVETCSFLPDDQSDRRDLACQGETSHRRLHPLGQQSLVEIVEGPGTTAGPCGRALEDIFEIMVVVVIETTKRRLFLGTSQLTFHVLLFRTTVRLESQPAIGPELPLGAEPIRCLDQHDQESGPDRADARNLT